MNAQLHDFFGRRLSNIRHTVRIIKRLLKAYSKARYELIYLNVKICLGIS